MKRRAPQRLALGLFILSLFAGASIAARTVWGDEGVPKRQSLQADLDRVTSDNVDLENQLEKIRREIVAQKERPEVH